MSPDRARELWSQFFSEGSLFPKDERELLEALERNPGLREEFLREMEADGLLRASAACTEDPESSVRAFLECLDAERDANRFIRDVHVRREKAVDAKRPNVAGRSTRRERGARLAKPRGPSLWGGLVAAGAILALVALFTVPTRAKPFAPKRSGTTSPEARREPVQPAPAAAEETRARAAEEVASLERRRRELQEEERKADEARQEELRRKAQEALLQNAAQSKAAQERLVRATEEARRPEPVPGERPPSPETRVSVATLEGIEGQVTVDNAPGQKGQAVLASQGLTTGPGQCRAVLVFLNQTRVELGAATVVREIRTEGGIGLRVEQGTLRAEVVQQPWGQPMVITTPHGEVTVLGTTLRIVVDPAGKGSTRLEVTEGKVKLKSSLDGKSVEVAGRHYAVAAAGIPLAVMQAERVIWRFDFEDGQRPAGVHQGTVSAVPPRPGNRFCLESSDFNNRLYGPTVNLKLDDLVGSDPENLRIRFRYFAPGGNRMTVQFFNETAGDNFFTVIEGLSTGRWAWAELPLSSFRKRSDGSRLRRADHLIILEMFVVVRENPSVYWDDIELVEILGR